MHWATQISGPVTAIGDVHGQADKLRRLIAQLRARADWKSRTLVFLGDFVDRGPDSKQVIDLILELKESQPAVTAVCGNHDLAMAAALGLLADFPPVTWDSDWTFLYDSEPTFTSYGAEPGDLEGLLQKLPESHQEFLRTLPWLVEHPDYYFVHAGLSGNLPLEPQLEAARAKVADPPWPAALCSKQACNTPVPAEWGKAVVQGHVVQPGVTFRPSPLAPTRILIDTSGGAVDSRLSGVLLPEGQVLSAGPPGKRAWGWPAWGQLKRST